MSNPTIDPAAINAIWLALNTLPTRCRYHGDQFDALGFQWGEPRCESCRQPYLATEALAALHRVRRS